MLKFFSSTLTAWYDLGADLQPRSQDPRDKTTDNIKTDITTVYII